MSPNHRFQDIWGEEMKFKISRRITCLLTGICLVSSLLCGLALPDSTKYPELHGAGSLRVAVQTEIRSLNPMNVPDVWAWNICDYIYDTPVLKNFTTGDLVPYITVGSANLSSSPSTIDWSDCTVGIFGYNDKSWWSNPNKPEATIFYDFENVTWHDGTQMTIRDIFFSYHATAQLPYWTSDINPLKDNSGRPGTNFPLDHMLYIDLVWVDGNKAALRFTLQEPFNLFFTNTLSVHLLPYHIWGTPIGGQSTTTKIWIDPGYTPGAPDAWNVNLATAFENSNPIGSGPFTFDSWNPGAGTSEVNTWNNHFYDENYSYSTEGKQPNIDEIFFRRYPTNEAANLALKNNDIDLITWTITPFFLQELESFPGISVQLSPEPGFSYLCYNMRSKSFGYPGNDPLNGDYGKPLRKAIAHCLDKDTIVRRFILGLGVPGDGAVYPANSWYNSSISKYPFDPQEAINILTNAGYQKTDPGQPPSPGNWWLNPDGTQIGSGVGGKIEMITVGADHDPVMAQAGLMLAQELQSIGIYAEAWPYQYSSLEANIHLRVFDMYIFSWDISSQPPEYLHRFFHSSLEPDGQNYPGYQNSTYESIIDIARQSDDGLEIGQAVDDAQASIAYDLPYDVLYYQINIECYRSDNFVGWEVDEYGTVFNRQTIYNLTIPDPIRLDAQFVSMPSVMSSEEIIPFTVNVVDQASTPIENAIVKVNATSGAVGNYGGLTTSSGDFITTYQAPYVFPTADAINNGTMVVLEIESATKVGYDPAPPKIKVITVYPASVQVSHDVQLCGGWNLISIPIPQEIESLDSVLSSIAGEWDYIQAYNATDPDHWKTNSTYKPNLLNDFSEIEHRIGFWIHITEAYTNLSINGTAPASTNITLYSGWNLVGYPSITNRTVADALFGTAADIVMVGDILESYNIREVGPTYVMHPGEGYWIHVPADTVWVVDW
jgi:ABC-type transport system substrate-binding protein